MDVLQRCRQLGFPVFIKTDKRIGELDSVTLLWLFYYLLEIYEPAWSHAPTAFTKSNYKPLSSSMRLLELGYKCPGSKQLKNPHKFERSIISSLGAVLDKLEGKYGKNKLYSTRFEHPSIKGMQQRKAKKKVKENNKTSGANNNVLTANINQENIKQSSKAMSIQNNKNKQIPMPRATSKDILAQSTKLYPSNRNQSEAYEVKKQETDASNTPNCQREEKSMDYVGAIETGAVNADVVMKESGDEHQGCDLNAFNVQLPRFKNETMKFHVQIDKNEKLSMAQRYEQLQRKESEKRQKINAMKKEYDQIRKQLNKLYAFHAKPFQNTSSTDYASFQLNSIRQKIKMEKEMKSEKSVELMEEDGVDSMLDNLANQIRGWSNGSR